MLKLITTTAALMALSLAGCTEKPAWNVLAPVERGTAYYALSPQDASSGNDMRGGSLRWVYTDPQHLTLSDASDVVYNVKEATLLLNCKSQTFALTDFAYLRKEDNKLTRVYAASEPPEQVTWQDLKTSALASAFAQQLKLCGPQRADAASPAQDVSQQSLMPHALEAHDKGLWMDCRNGDPYVFYQGRVWLQGEKSLIFPAAYQYKQGVIRWSDGVIDDLHHELALSTMQERTSIAGPFACKVVKGSTQAL